MPNASLVGTDNAGGGAIGSAGVNTKLRWQGTLVAVVGDPIANHGSGAHAAATITGGSAKMTIQGAAVARAGDAASCGHTVTGSSTLNVVT